MNGSSLPVGRVQFHAGDNRREGYLWFLESPGLTFQNTCLLLDADDRSNGYAVTAPLFEPDLG